MAVDYRHNTLRDRSFTVQIEHRSYTAHEQPDAVLTGLSVSIRSAPEAGALIPQDITALTMSTTQARQLLDELADGLGLTCYDKGTDA